MEASDMVLINTFFQKKEEHLVSYKNGNNKLQIDYIMVRKLEQKFVRDCKVIPGAAVVPQHRMVVAVIRARDEETRKRVVHSRIKMWKLKGDNIKEYQEKVAMSQQLFSGVTSSHAQACHTLSAVF